MYANSSSISSAQSGPHEQLAALVARHVAHPFQQPIADYNREAFQTSIAHWHARGGAPLILDALLVAFSNAAATGASTSRNLPPR
jgi:tRNA (guanine-N7-)-methyltransferase